MLFERYFGCCFFDIDFEPSITGPFELRLAGAIKMSTPYEKFVLKELEMQGNSAQRISESRA